MLDLLDDCARVLTASKLDERELWLAYCDRLPAAFVEDGLPVELSVDYHSLFFSSVPAALTQLGAALPIYGVSFRSAPTPPSQRPGGARPPGLAASLAGLLCQRTEHGVGTGP